MPEKYQDEIEEILKGIEGDGPVVPPRNSQPILDDLPAPAPGSEADREPGHSGAGPRSRWQSITPGKVALVGLALLLLGGVMGPVAGAGWSWLVWAGLVGLAAAYLLFFVRPRPVNQDKRWRGRSVESRGPSPWQRFKGWIKE